MVDLFRIARVHGMYGSQSVAGLRYALVEGVLLQLAVRLHQNLVRSAPVGKTPGSDQVIEKAEARDHPAYRDGTRTALAATRRQDHDRATPAASNIDSL